MLSIFLINFIKQIKISNTINLFQKCQNLKLTLNAKNIRASNLHIFVWKHNVQKNLLKIKILIIYYVRFANNKIMKIIYNKLKLKIFLKISSKSKLYQFLKLIH